ncbi:MAG: ribosome biogenesis GTPase Der [Planctomycetota bacterium]|jgi:GTP-binding protein
MHQVEKGTLGPDIVTLPVVAIVGRPNVGKSSLFNTIARRRTAIVDPTAGVTRDRVTTICDVDDTFFELVDTGGHGIVDRDDLSEHVERQIEYAINQADLILFVVDAREGLTPLDTATAELLRPHHDSVRLIANKVDEPHMADGIAEFFKLGFGEPMLVSAANGSGRRELMEFIEETIAGDMGDVPADAVMKIAIVGKRNAGKSSFINALAGEDRVIVSETPGTTRDSIDVRFEKDDRTLVAIDTAGLRKKRKIADDVEFYARSRATHSIRRADVVLCLIDATVPVGRVDKGLAKLIASEHKPCILVVNKWDQAKGRASSEDYGEYLGKVLPEVDYAPVAFTSAIDGRNISSTIDLATELFKQSRLRVGTGRLNQVLKDAVASYAPHGKRGKKAPRFYFATQVATSPPTIVVFVNTAALVSPNYQRFLLNRFRESLPYGEIPIRLVFRARRARGIRG